MQGKKRVFLGKLTTNREYSMQHITNRRKSTRRKLITGLIILLFTLCGIMVAIFSRSSTVAPFLAIGEGQTQPSKTSDQALKNVPSETPAPTNLPLPTDTAFPSASNTPVPDPIFLTGSGDTSVDVDKWNGPAVLHAQYLGNDNFVIQHYHTNDTGDIHVLISTIGPYEGTVPLDFLSGDQTGRFEIKAEGQWEMQIQPLENLHKIAIPATIQGRGDDVFAIEGTGDLIKADASQARSSFIIHSFGNDRQSVVFNETAPYAGISLLPPATSLLIITANGPWSLEITTR
jgi:hypothetical protein